MLLTVLALTGAAPQVLQAGDIGDATPDAGASGAGAPPTTSVYMYSNRQGVTSFSDRAPVGISYRKIEIRTDCFACKPRSGVDWHSTPLQLTAFQGPINDAARRHRVDPALIRAVIHAESGFRPEAQSSAGALGLMQLMPQTARELGVSDPLSPVENIHGGVRYLASLMRRNGGNITLATAAYNAGPGAVERYQGVPPFPETETYVRRVRILLGRYRRDLARLSSS